MDSPLRTYANQTQGELLLNEQGYVIYTGYLKDAQSQFVSLAKNGSDYKQILFQVYNQEPYNFGAKNLAKFHCEMDTSSCGISEGVFANWKQYDAAWGSVSMGNSGKNIQQIGCLVTSVSMLIAKSGVSTNINDFNPGTFVEFLNSHGGFSSGGNFVWAAATQAAPSFKYQGKVNLSGLSKEQKFSKIREIVQQPGNYAVVEVKGNTGQHWVAIDSIDGDTIHMMDPGSTSTDLWGQYNWNNTSVLSYYRVG